MRQKLLSFLIVCALFFSVLTPVTPVQAEPAVEAVSEKTGFVPMQEVELSEEDVLVFAGSQQGYAQPTGEQIAYWTGFSSDYFYNTLTDAEKQVWDAMEEGCILVAVNDSIDAQAVQVVDNTGSISIDRMRELILLFKYSNPQYYFLSNTYSYGNHVAYLLLYDRFMLGSERAVETQRFTSQIDAWVAEVKRGGREEEKERIAHDIVCANTVYDWAALGNGAEAEAAMDIDQSAYSMVCTGKTVCTGYAAVTGMLLNAVGIETVMVTSAAHAWNNVRLHGIWYELDTTWDDTDGEPFAYYDYYNKSRETVRDEDGNHDEEWLYDGLTLDMPYDMFEGWEHEGSPYFQDSLYVYFVVNSNTDLGPLSAKVINTVGTISTSQIPGTITNGGVTYNVINDPVENFVMRMYTVALGRPADERGLDSWVALLKSGENVGSDIANGFIMSQEFQDKNLSDEEFVRTLYYTFFDAMDEVGCRSWVELLAVGNSRRYVLGGFANSLQFTNLCAEYGIERGLLDTSGELYINVGIGDFVRRLYRKTLGREADAPGLIDWCTRIASGQLTFGEVGKNFFRSEEFGNMNLSYEDYVETLYETFLDRASDPDGKADWVGTLRSGTDPEDVLDGFANSNEFKNIAAGYGL